MSAISLIALIVFAVALVCVVFEEQIHLRKSIPAMIAAGVIWLMAALSKDALTVNVRETFQHVFLEFSELFFFVLAAVTFVNTLEELKFFEAIKGWLIGRGWSLRRMFWATGAMAFLLSPIADNLTTTLVIGSVVIAVGGTNSRFVSAGCVNVVVAANAGGAFSPFGDITTLMVWQAGHLGFFDFFVIFLPSVLNWLVPAAIMSFAVGSDISTVSIEKVLLRKGALTVLFLFLATIGVTVYIHQAFHLPPVLGMMFGLSILQLYSFFLTNRGAHRSELLSALPHDAPSSSNDLDIFRILGRTEWDTLMFFYGIILAVGGLGAFGLLNGLAHVLYGGLGTTAANISIGFISALLDNIPVMFAVLSMNPPMDSSEWLLVTLTAGVGGSLLSIGSAAGVALMGQARGIYTFQSHLKWTPAVLVGYVVSVALHIFLS